MPSMPDKQTAARPVTNATAIEPNHSYAQYSTTFDHLPVTLTATPALQSCARHLAAGRQRGKHLADASTSIGSEEADFEATYYGTLAELLLYHWLEQQGRHPEYV